MRNFIIKSKFLDDYFCFLPIFFRFWHSTTPKNGFKNKLANLNMTLSAKPNSLISLLGNDENWT